MNTHGKKSVARIALRLIAVAATMLVPYGGVFAAKSCEPYYVEYVQNKAYFVQNNQWGSSEQHCVNVNGTSFTITDSALNNPTNSKPGAYPSVVKGRHYGNKTAGWVAKKLSELISISSSTRIQSAAGNWNASWDIWFDPKPDSQTAAQIELMIWIKQSGDMRPAGEFNRNTTIGGARYEVWHGDHVTTYRRLSSVSSSRIDIKLFADDMVKNARLRKSDYLTSIQGGFEVWSNGKSLKMNFFSASVK